MYPPIESMQILGKKFTMSVAVVMQSKGEILLIQEKDGKYGPPSGHCDENEIYDPSTTLWYEMWEEIGMVPVSFRLYGAMISFEVTKISIGLVYLVFSWRIVADQLTDEDVVNYQFFSNEEVKGLLKNGKIRYPKWNVPVLQSWLQHQKYLFQIVHKK